MKLGAHLSTAGGYHNALKKIVEIGGNTLQMFSTSPRIWLDPDLSNETIEQFIILKKSLMIDPIYFHATYLINLADSGKIGELSKKSIIEELKTASQLGIKGSVIHVGSFKDNFDKEVLFSIVISNIKEILSKTPPNTLFIIENAGNKKIGQKLEDISNILKSVNSNRVKVCLDTCHLHAAGYDLSTTDKLEEFLEMFETIIGLDRLELIHLNDSRDPFNSGRDRHENLGDGYIKLPPLKLIINHPKLKNIPFILEVPGTDKKGPDKKNIDIAKSLYSI